MQTSTNSKPKHLAVVGTALAFACCLGVNAAESNIALNLSGTGYPDPLESDPGWGGGSYPGQIVDGLTVYSSWPGGLAFTGGNNNWAGQPCGPRQATINFGANRTFNKVVIWQHGDDHLPAQASLAYWDGAAWKNIPFTRDYSQGTSWSRPDQYTLSPVTGSKVRWSMDNCSTNILGSPITHGWIYEFEVWGGDYLVDLKMYAGLSIYGDTPANYRIDVTSKLGGTNAWTTLKALGVTNSPYLFIDTNTPAHPSQFYRAVALPGWSRVATNDPVPPRRAEGSCIYDPTHDVMVIFGGNVNRCTFDMPYNDVWMLNHATGFGGAPTWQQLLPTGALPSPRMGHQAVYNPTTDRMVFFGGDLTCGCSKLNDLWILTNATARSGIPGWASVTSLGGPPAARNDHVAVYDAANNRMIIFGGFYCTVNLNDVWVLENADATTGTPQWVPLAPAGSPPLGRLAGSGVYDAASNRMIIFGGTQCCGYPRPYYNDVWVLTNANGLGGTPQWLQLNPTGALPSGRTGHIGAYNPATKRMIVFGGTPGPGNDVWVLSDADGTSGTPQWQQLTAGGDLPTGRGGENGEPFSAYDPVSNRLTIFGGGTSGTPNTTDDTYILSNANGAGSL